MTYEEAKKAIDDFKGKGYTDEEVILVLHDMFRKGDITFDELAELVRLVGYEVTEKFRNMSPEEQKESLYEDEESENEESENEKKPDDEEEKARKLFGLEK